VLQDRADTLHVFIYAPQCERIARVRQRVPAENNPEELIRSMDRQRSEYIRIYFGCNWSDPHLYHMLISSEVGEDEVASIIIETIEGSENRRA